ncbi:uncharacterized protein cfap97d2 [Hypomesus transpacificus]|uniref:uncharacterized protein cfap97d2 n=1 Tax=Hypomesus transpacificus TaxID=137520 RepID=UPI001F08428F|nr:uncharacterized protein cfap97d2 [Hypomesus transpacificus]
MQQLMYQPLLSTGNRYLQQRWDKTSYDMHRRNVVSAKSTLDTTPPISYEHLSNNMKKQKLEEEQMSKIQRENHMLLEKISHIMRTTGRIDNKNDYHHKSLSRERRKQELRRITLDNQLIVQRLAQCQPHYRAKDWHHDWLKTCKLMESIGIFPRTAPDKKASSTSHRSERGALQSDTEPSQSNSGRDTEEESRPEAPEPSPQCHSHTSTKGDEEMERSSKVQVQEERGNQQDTAAAPDNSDKDSSTDTPNSESTPRSQESQIT